MTYVCEGMECAVLPDVCLIASVKSAGFSRTLFGGRTSQLVKCEMNKGPANSISSYAEEILAASSNAGNVFGDSAELLQKVLDTIPQRVFWKDRNMVYLGCNQLFANDAGLKCPEEIVGKTDFELPWDKSEAEFFRTCDKRIMETNKAEIEIVEPQLTASGQRTWLETNKVPLHDDTGLVIGILGTYHDITKQKIAERTLKQTNEELENRVRARTRELRFLAQHDSLTGLVNRSCFVEKLNKAIDEKERFALLFVDLDQFKPINDKEGHDAGDHVLKQVAQILLDEVGRNDVAGRFGGDEFVILLRGTTDEPTAREVCGRLQERFAVDVELHDRHQYVSASLGVLFSNPKVYTTADTMVRDADIAMYVAKESGIGKYCIYDDVILKQVKRKRQIENEILPGLRNREFSLHYQPIMNLSDQSLSGVEALVRWHHPQLGMVPPLDFIPIAERTGIIVDLGDFILQQACERMQIWSSDIPDCRESLSINVNFSSIQVAEPEFLSKFLSIVSDAGLSPRSIKLEITESVLLNDRKQTIEVLEQLRSEGFSIVLDDFGTGYSSLSYLDSLPINTVKIDRSFVQNIESPDGSQAIVRMILALAKTLEMSVVAEGVETQGQADRLLEMGCDQVQGYFYGKPMDAEAATRFIAQHEF